MTSPRTVSVHVDVPAVDRAFDYRVPDELGDRIVPGTIVRVDLAGRRVRGWVVALDPESPPGVTLAPLRQVSGIGPDAEVQALCRWAAWRWAGRTATFLRLASPERRVSTVVRQEHRPPRVRGHERAAELLERGEGVHLLEYPVDGDPVDVALAAAELGQSIVVAPSAASVTRVGTGLRRAGAFAARWPRDFAAAAAGATVVGGRGAVFAPAPALRSIVVIDEHDERLQNEASPTWHARELAIERARRAGVPCLLVSPVPSLEARRAAASGPVVDRAAFRSGWPTVRVVDRREEDRGRSGLFAPALVEQIRLTLDAGERVVCVLNRTGRARLLACRTCGGLLDCELCGATVRQDDAGELVCARCDTRRPRVCRACGSTATANLRPGVSTVREQLEALVREPVCSLTGGERPGPSDPALDRARVVVGTEAVLHRVDRAGLVAFLEFDAELLAPRYRAAEQALALVVAAGRLTGGRGRSLGSVLLQTRAPEHPVVRASVRADPDELAEAEWDRRVALADPPAATLAVVGREAAPEFMVRLELPAGVEQVGPDERGRWVLRSERAEPLLDALAAVERPPGRLRLWVDPARTG
ncbi:MAG: hypothetical protein ACOYOQ_00750 [Microthrixaceae bacterium]